LAWFDKHLLFQATAALGAKAAAGDDQYLGSMGQSIRPSRGQQGVTQKHWLPATRLPNHYRDWTPTS
jgi:hypothetical protein